MSSVLKHARRLWGSLLLPCMMLLSSSCGQPATTPAGPLYIAAAADLRYAMDELIRQFSLERPDVIMEVTYGSSGNFHAQLLNRAPFDLYFSADMRYPRQLAEAGLADSHALFHYAVGRLVVWTLLDSPIDVESLGINALLHADAKKVAIANPRHAPYGVAAEQALKSFGIYENVSPRLALGENIAQTAQFIESGAASIGIIALSLAVAPPLAAKGKYWEIPLDHYTRMDQGGVILPWTKQPENAQAFRDFVISEQGRDILRSFGFLMQEDF